jgi:hypothetical protein
MSLEDNYWGAYQMFLNDHVDTEKVKLASYNWAEVQHIAKTSGVDEDNLWKGRMRADNDLRKEYRDWLDENGEKITQALLQRNNTIDSMASIFQRADRILTGLGVNVLFTETGDTPAYSNGKDITFNAKLINLLDEKLVLTFNGLNYHELSHLLYTPRANNKLGKWVMEQKHTVTKEVMNAGTPDEWVWERDVITEYPNRKIAFNMLEDNRAETMLVAKYPSVRPFLIATVGEYLLDNPINLADNFVLLAGRRYFSQEVRQLSANAHMAKYGAEKTKTIFNIVNEYRSLVYPRQYDRGIELINQLAEMLPENYGSTCQGWSCSGRDPLKNGRPVGEKEQDGLSGDKGDKADLDFSGKSPESDDDTKGKAGKGNTGETEDSDNKPDKSDFNIISDELTELIKAEVERAKADKGLTKKVKDTMNAIIKDRSVKSILPKGRASSDEPTIKEVNTARRFASELERLRIECDPAWIRQVPSGKLNVKRAMNADINDINKLFDRWREGSDDYQIEASVLVDRSGSMYSQIGSASRSGWIIKRAIEKIDGKVSLLTFSDIGKTLSSRDEKAKANVVRIPDTTGGTDPYSALVETNRIMELSNANTKLVFILTDGEFSNTDKCEKVIARLQEQGCYVVVVYIADEHTLRHINEYANNPITDTSDPNYYWATYYGEDYFTRMAHGADLFQMVTDPDDLVKVAKGVVKGVIKTTLDKH